MASELVPPRAINRARRFTRGYSASGKSCIIPSGPSSVVVPLWRDGLFWLTLALSWFAIAPFTLPGYFWGANDARHHVYFLFEYNRLVADGIWWPRWSPDFAFGYGYPFFNIYAPLSHFLAELLLHFLGFSYTAAVESVFGLSVIGSATAMYLFVRSWGGRQAAMLSALVYVYFPYHLLNLYVRANLAESMAFVWMPFCLWTMRQLLVRPRYGWLVGLALSYGALMLTSNLIVVLFSPFLALYAVVLTFVYGAPADRRKAGVGEWVVSLLRRGLPGVLGLLAGLGLSAIFWLPMVLEYRWVRVDQWFDGRYDFGGHFIEWYQLFSPDWGFGVSMTGPDDPIGFQLGVAALLAGDLGLLLGLAQGGAVALGDRRLDCRCVCQRLCGVDLGCTLVAVAPDRLLVEFGAISLALVECDGGGDERTGGVAAVGCAGQWTPWFVVGVGGAGGSGTVERLSAVAGGD